MTEIAGFQNFLYELRTETQVYSETSPLVEMLKRENEERKRIDDEYLASLSEAERRRVLLRRRIEAVGRRCRNWWEQNMAWRLRADPPDCGCY